MTDDRLTALIDSTCHSVWEGHICALPKDHDGLHICASDQCGAVVWNTGDATLWIEGLVGRTDDEGL